MCNSVVLDRGAPVDIQPFVPGIWSSGDPNADFYERVLAPDGRHLRLPSGRWRVYAWSFAADPAGVAEPSLETSLEILVG